MKLIRTVDAEGAVLCHDITQIIKGVTKDAVFRKGHVVTKEDIPVLLSVGKDQLYVWEKEEGMLHENDAAEILCAMCKMCIRDSALVIQFFPINCPLIVGHVHTANRVAVFGRVI